MEVEDFLDKNLQDPMISGFENDDSLAVKMFDKNILFDESLMNKGEMPDENDLASLAQQVPAAHGQVYHDLHNAAPYDEHGPNNAQGNFGQQGYPSYCGYQDQLYAEPQEPYKFMAQYTEPQFLTIEDQAQFDTSFNPDLSTVAAAIDPQKYETSYRPMVQEPAYQPMPVAPQAQSEELLDLNAVHLQHLEAPSRYNKRQKEPAQGKPYGKRSTRQTRKMCSMLDDEDDEEEDQGLVPVAPPVSQARRVRGKPAAAGDLTSVQKHRKKEKDFITTAPKIIEELGRRNAIIEDYNRELKATIPVLARMIQPYTNQPESSHWHHNGY